MFGNKFQDALHRDRDRLRDELSRQIDVTRNVDARLTAAYEEIDRLRHVVGNPVDQPVTLTQAREDLLVAGMDLAVLREENRRLSHDNGKANSRLHAERVKNKTLRKNGRSFCKGCGLKRYPSDTCDCRRCGGHTFDHRLPRNPSKELFVDMRPERERKPRPPGGPKSFTLCTSCHGVQPFDRKECRRCEKPVKTFDPADYGSRFQPPTTFMGRSIADVIDTMDAAVSLAGQVRADFKIPGGVSPALFKRLEEFNRAKRKGGESTPDFDARMKEERDREIGRARTLERAVKADPAIAAADALVVGVVNRYSAQTLRRLVCEYHDAKVGPVVDSKIKIEPKGMVVLRRIANQFPNNRRDRISASEARAVLDLLEGSTESRSLELADKLADAVNQRYQESFIRELAAGYRLNRKAL